MSLSKKRNKERMRLLRATGVQPKGIQTLDNNIKPAQPELYSSHKPVQPKSLVKSNLSDVKPKLNIKGLTMEGNKITVDDMLSQAVNESLLVEAQILQLADPNSEASKEYQKLRDDLKGGMPPATSAEVLGRRMDW